MGRYIIRMYSAKEQENSTAPGTVVKPVNIQMSFYEDSADDAEKKLYSEVEKGKLPKGRVYQICPSMGSLEPIRSCAVDAEGSGQRVFLDPADGLYGELRRIRLPRPKVTEGPPLEAETHTRAS